MKKLALILVVLFAFAAVGVAAEKKAAGADKPADKAADTKGEVKSTGTLISIDKEKKEIVVDLGKKKKAEKKTFAVDAKILESLKDVKEGVMVTVTLKDDKVVSVKLAEKKKEEGEKKGTGAK